LLPFDTWLRGVAQTWRDEILRSIGMLRGGNTAPTFVSSARPKQRFDFGGLLLVNE